MQLYRNSLLMVICFHLFVVAISQDILSGEEAAEKFFNIPEDFKRQIRDALPREAPVKDIATKKLLIFNLHLNKEREVLRGHYSIPYANYALFMMGKSTGAFDTWFSSDTLVFQPETMEQFDAICFNNTAGVLFDDRELRMNLLDYVYGGKGFVGIHAAAATFVQWPVYDQFPEFGVMLGGYENGGHPWNDNEWITVQVNEPDHPVNRVLDFTHFEVSDEVFQFSAPYSRNLVRVLLSIDPDKTDMSSGRRILPERKLDRDLAMSWVKSYGSGRVYYSSFGDNPHINWDTRILTHYLAGIQFALGDLQAPATPSDKLTPAILAQEKLNWRFGLSAYSFRDLTLFETIDHAKALGILYLEGMNVQKVSREIDKQFDHNLSEEELYIIRDKLIESGINITNYYIHDIPADEATCEKIFAFGKKMGIETFLSEPEVEALDMIDRFCNKYRIRVAIHNHGKDVSPVYWNPEELMKVCHSRSKYIGVCGDLGYWMRSGIDPAAAINIVNDRLIGVQIHDLNLIDTAGHDVPWGEGQADLQKFFSELRRLNIEPVFIGLEYSHNWGKSMPDIKKSIEFFNRVVVELANDQR